MVCTGSKMIYFYLWEIKCCQLLAERRKLVQQSVWLSLDVASTFITICKLCGCNCPRTFSQLQFYESTSSPPIAFILLLMSPFTLYQPSCVKCLIHLLCSCSCPPVSLFIAHSHQETSLILSVTCWFPLLLSGGLSWGASPEAVHLTLGTNGMR